MNFIEAKVTGVEHLTRPLWPATDEGDLYRQLLVSALQDTAGFVNRAFPESHVVHNVFADKASVVAFLSTHKALLADMMAKAKAYYELDSGCSAAVEIVTTVDGEATMRLAVANIADPESYQA